MTNHLETPDVSKMVREEVLKVLRVYETNRSSLQAQTDQKELRFAELRKELIADEKTLDGYTVFIEYLRGLANGRD